MKPLLFLLLVGSTGMAQTFSMNNACLTVEVDGAEVVIMPSSNGMPSSNSIPSSKEGEARSGGPQQVSVASVDSSVFSLTPVIPEKATLEKAMPEKVTPEKVTAIQEDRKPDLVLGEEGIQSSSLGSISSTESSVESRGKVEEESMESFPDFSSNLHRFPRIGELW